MQKPGVYTGGSLVGTATLAGGNATQTATVNGVAATDTVIATIKTAANAVYLRSAAATANTLTFVFSADPGAATVQYMATHRVP